MKILRLDLRAFGPFTDVALDLSAGTEGLHIVYGPNEAGKSSALRAIRAMLYGISIQTPDDFRHKYDKLAVGGTLRSSDGRELSFLRLKRQNNPLRESDGQTAHEDAALDPFLQGVSESQFKTLFAIDHGELTQGGKTILEGKTELGQLLFAAGTGLTTARQVQSVIREEYEKLFKSGGRNPPINRAISEFAAARKATNEAMKPSAEWDKHDDLLRKAQAAQTRLEARLAEIRRDQRRLERIRDAAPLLAQRRLKADQLTALGELPALPADFRERWRKTGNDLERSQRTQAEAEAEAKEIAGHRAAVSVPHDLLSLAETIAPLRDALASYRADRQNRPVRVSERDLAEDTATRRLLELGLDPEQPPRITRAQRNAIQRLSQDLPSARKERNRLIAEVEKATTERRQLVSERAALPDSGDPEMLSLALERARGAGDLDTRLADLDATIERLNKQISRDAALLKHWNGPVAQLDALPLPTLAEIDTAGDTLGDLDKTLRDAADKVQEARQSIARAEEAIRQLRLSGDVPTEAELSTLREHRDALWDRVRRHWMDGEIVDSSSDLLADYGRAVRQADELADRLRREAGRVAQLAQLESQREQANSQAAILAEQVADAQSRRDAAQNGWNALWAPGGIVPDAPRAMRDWLTQRVEPLRAKLIEREKLQIERHTASDLRETIRDNLNAILTALNARLLDADASYSATIDNAQATLNLLRQQARERGEIDRDLRKRDDDIDTLRSQLDAAQTAMAGHEAEWVQAITVLGLDAKATPEQATGALEALDEAVKNRDEAGKLARDIATIDRATSGFVDRVRDLASRVVPPIAEDEPEVVAQRLLARLDDARKREKEAEALDHRLTKVQEKAQLAREAAAGLEIARDAMVREAACQTPEEVPAVLAAIEEARPLRESIATIEDSLLQLGRGATLSQIAEEVASVPADDLESRVAHAEAEIAALNSQLEAQQKTIGAEQNELAKMDGSDAAAEAAAKANSLAAQIASQVDHYVRLRLAGALLKEGIERHRQRNQGPILGRAGAHFARLTRGSFETLQVGEGSKGEPILVGVRPGGEIVKVDGLSDGTADALYLSLRLAGLEVHLDAHPPMPLIVDDILIQFDDDRAMAALGALAALSERTQVLLFTHHRRLVDLALNLDASTCFLHELSGSRS